MSQKTFNIILATDSTGGIGLEKDGNLPSPGQETKGRLNMPLLISGISPI